MESAFETFCKKVGSKGTPVRWSGKKAHYFKSPGGPGCMITLMEEGPAEQVDVLVEEPFSIKLQSTPWEQFTPGLFYLPVASFRWARSRSGGNYSISPGLPLDPFIGDLLQELISITKQHCGQATPIVVFPH